VIHGYCLQAHRSPFNGQDVAGAEFEKELVGVLQYSSTTSRSKDADLTGRQFHEVQGAHAHSTARFE